MVDFKITENEAGQRLDRFLRKYMKRAPLSMIYKTIRKDVKVNGKRAHEDTILQEGDQLSLYIPEEKLNDLTRQQTHRRVKRQFRIAYEDENLLIVEKPSGLLTHGDSREKKNTLANQVCGYLQEKGEFDPSKEKSFVPSPVNRLDRNTSGLLLCGKSLLGTQKLTGLIRNRQIHKYYRLFLLGEVKEKQILNGYLLKDTKKNQVKILTKPAEGADEIKTGIEPLACLELPGIGTVTYAQAELFTGKTHQIRAHFAWAGHPLLGDPKYGNEAVNRTLKQTYGIGRQLLHAWQIRQKDAASGILPTGGITCPLPEDFQKLLSTAGIQP